MHSTLTQLPDDAKLIGYKQSRPFHFEAVYKSVSCDFIGSESDFVKSGNGYFYLQIDKYTRRAMPCIQP